MIQVFRNRDSAAIVEASGNSWGEDIVAGSLANAFGSGEPQVVSIGCPVDEAHPEGECSDAFVIAFASDTPGRLSAFGFLRQEGEVELLTGMYTVEGDAAIIVQEGGVPGRECISGRIPKTDEDCQQSYFYPWIGD